jgi:hypothetical protein
VLIALEANGAETKILLDQILKRLDDNAALASKRYEEQASFNTVVSQDLQAMRKQIDLTRADVDEARHAASVVTAPATASWGTSCGGGRSGCGRISTPRQRRPASHLHRARLAATTPTTCSTECSTTSPWGQGAVRQATEA